MHYYYVLVKRPDKMLPVVVWAGDVATEHDDEFRKACENRANAGAYVMKVTRFTGRYVEKAA